MLLYWLYSYCFDTKSINCEVSALFSAADRCFPRARLQPPRETHSAGSSDTCCSRRSQRSFAPNNHRNSESELYTTVAKRHVSEGNTRRLLRESEDDETPQRAFCASEEAHREPAESVVYFQSGMLLRSLHQLGNKTTLEKSVTPYLLCKCSLANPTK